MIIASYFTGPDYAGHADRLRESCNRFGLRNVIQQVPDKGSWKENIKQKAEVVLYALLNYRVPVLWVDADCEFKLLPVLLFQGQHDFAVYNWKVDPININMIAQVSDRLQCSAGVVYFGYTAPALELLFRWHMECARLEVSSDDEALDNVYNNERPPVNPLWLPRAYNRMADYCYWPETRPVIEHYHTNGKHSAYNQQQAQGGG